MADIQNDKSLVFPLRNKVRNYAWGSYDGFSRYTGITQDRDKPSAEYWMGAHPNLSSDVLLQDGTALALNRLIHDFPLRTLGEEIFSEFGELPFLFKVLSASMPLSIQVHPDKEMAERGFASEEAKNLPMTAPERNYRDRNHKPELAVALSDFSALCGFRPAGETALLLGTELCDFFSFSPARGEDSLRALIFKALSVRDKDRSRMETLVLARARKLAGSGDPLSRAAGEAVALCDAHYPHDPAVMAPLFMAVHRLTPGQGLYVPAGVMHAYLSGTILEIMATSDNVIRGGLTHKYIDIEDLLRTLRFDASPLRVDPEPDTEEPCALHWRTPAREFSLSKYVLQTQASVGFTVSGPEILLCTEGTCVVRPSAADLPVTLGKGTSVFISPASKNCTLRGEAVVYRARTAAAEHRLS